MKGRGGSEVAVSAWDQRGVPSLPLRAFCRWCRAVAAFKAAGGSQGPPGHRL